MSGWGRWDWPKPPPKHPPPQHGVKVKKAGTTWWGKRWIEALEQMSREYSNRLGRGRSYARAGRVHDVVVKPGVVTAKVTGSRAKPYDIRIALDVLSDPVWDGAVIAMAREARFAAQLLAGEMPQDVDTAFAAAGASLFPSKREKLDASCSCPDWANPCKHVAAVHYVLGEAFDRDPFVLFELRGRTKQRVLEELRAARTGARDPSAGPGPRRKKGKSIRAATAAAVIERPPSESLQAVAAADYGNARAPLPALKLEFALPRSAGVLLQQLGKPKAWSDVVAPAELLGVLIRAAAERAREWSIANEIPAEAARAETAGASLRDVVERPKRRGRDAANASRCHRGPRHSPR